MLLSRDIYGVLGIFVFGSLVTQLLTDTSKYTIGELAMTTIEYVKRFLPRQTQAAFPHSLSTQYNIDQHSGSVVIQSWICSLFLPS